ncbi:hypothetical protein ABXT08_09675 [Chryseobacterium sp. NRRL B-14859]|uniref:hypothetical protein n=1 Tax=Chryseobacterium sp. NRRL B-14859 TaxID=1562763 RepID=UPI00339636FD
MKEETLKQLRSEYEKLEIKPSEDLWERIEQGEEKSPVVSSKKGFQWWKYAAVLILLFSIVTLWYFNHNSEAVETDRIVYSTSAVKKTEPLMNSRPEPKVILTENKAIPKAEKSNPEIKKVTGSSEGLTSKTVLAKEERILIPHEPVIIPQNDLKVPVLETGIGPMPEKNNLTDRKKGTYIKADELLLGREFDKKREENRTDYKKFGTLDMTKIKIKSPNSFKVFGMTVYSDSLETK